MTNPLDLRGPEFLAFYVVYGLVVFLLAAWLRSRWARAPSLPWERAGAPGFIPGEEDAYAIALLRGDPQEVVRTVVGRLVAEGFLVLDGSALRLPAEPLQSRSRLLPLEEEVLQSVTAAAAAGEIEARDAVARGTWDLQSSLERLGRELESAGLTPKPELKRDVRVLALAAFLLVVGLGVVKLFVALYRGRSNVQFLILLLIAAMAVSFALIKSPRRTALGERYLDWLQRSHQGLASLLSDGRRQSFGELALVTGIFGIGYLPVLASLQTALGAAARACAFRRGERLRRNRLRQRRW